LRAALSGKEPDEVAKARIGLCRVIVRHAVGWLKNHPDAVCRHPSPLCHNKNLASERVIPFLAKTGLKALICECELAGIMAYSGAKH
jgi:hypothetical protein